MRVEGRWALGQTDEAVEVPWENHEKGTRYLNLRDDPSAVAEIEAARRQRPLHNLLVALNSADSLLLTIRAQIWLEPDVAARPDISTFMSRLDLAFGEMEMNFDRTPYTMLLEGLTDLLAREGADTLHAELNVHRCWFHDPGRGGYALGILLAAQGETPGQAELRWGLGLARVQQALMFLSRVIRQQWGRAGQA